jgi:DNA-binding NarL/FixJ family response regulator
MRVLLADDHTLVRAGIRALLENLPGVEIVAETGDGQEALALIREKRPEIAFVDIAMPGLNGLEIAARATREFPGTKVVILSMHGTPGHVAQALRAGVSGYVLKDAAADELPILLRAGARDKTYLPASTPKHVVEGYLGRAAAGSNGVAEGEPLDVLTPRQREILQLVAEGKSTKEVAQVLGLSAKTVETHRSQIMDRLNIRDLAGLVRYAVRTGLVSSDR